MGLSNEFRIKFHRDHKSADYIYNLLFSDLQYIHGNVMLVGLANTYIYKKFLERNHAKIDKLYIVDDYGMNYFVKYLNYVDVKIYFINTDKFIGQKNMPKFDYIIQNPPYNGSTHLKFFNKGFDLLNTAGKMVIVEPATWLINIRKTGKASIYDEIKTKLKGQVKKVIIENFNNEFGTTNTTPFAITYIDKSYNYNTIEYINCGYKQIVNSLYDCNNIGSYNIIHSILNKIICDKIINHRTNTQNKDKNIYYCQITDYVWGQCGLYMQRPHFCNSDSSYFKHKSGEYFQSFVGPALHISRNEITNVIPKKAARGGSTKGKVKLTNNPATCIFGTKNEVENYKHFVSNNKLPIFINIVMTIDMANNSIPYIPWLVDKQYTDEEIYKKFNFNKEEIELIENTIKRYERYSPWFKRYMTGDTSIKINQKYPWLEEDA